MTAHEITIDSLTLRKAGLLYRAVNHKLRQAILQLLHTHLRFGVTEIYTKLKIEQSVASAHLATLRRAGVVTFERQGKHVFYSVNYERLKELHKAAGELLSYEKH